MTSNHDTVISTLHLPSRVIDAQWAENGRVFHGRGDDVLTLVPEGEEHSLEREVVALAAAACEHHLVHGTAEQVLDLTARLLQASFAGTLAQCPLDGLPKASTRNGRMAAETAGSIGVLAL